METTGIKDYDGNEIFVGSKVLHCWGIDMVNEKPVARYRVHEVIKYVDGNEVHYRLDSLANRWDGDKVRVVSDEEFTGMGVGLGEDFFFNDKECVKFGSKRHHELKSDTERERDERLQRGFNERLAKALFNGL